MADTQKNAVFRVFLPATMGKSQSKLSPEQLADLQKNTYCTLSLSSILMLILLS